MIVTAVQSRATSAGPGAGRTVSAVAAGVGSGAFGVGSGAFGASPPKAATAGRRMAAPMGVARSPAGEQRPVSKSPLSPG
jgi:hypothetical protein